MWATIPMLRMRSLGNDGTGGLGGWGSVQVAAAVVIRSARPVGLGARLHPLPLGFDGAQDLVFLGNANVVDRAEQQHALAHERRVFLEPVAQRVDQLLRAEEAGPFGR